VGFVNSIFNFLHFKKRNWKAVVLCIFAATVFWFFNALNKNYATNITFPLAFEYDQDRFVPVNSLPEKIRLNINGQGWDLFRQSLGIKVPVLSIPLDKPLETKRIVGSTLPILFSNQLSDVQINFALADTLHVDLDEKVKKVVSLQADSVPRFIHPDFGIAGEVTLVPESVTLEGPKKIIKAIAPSIQVSLPKSGISKAYDEEVELLFEHNDLIKRNPPLVQVKFQVERMAEVSNRIPLIVLHLPNRLKPQINVTEVQCTYRIPVRLTDKISADSVHAMIDLARVSKGKHTLAPQVVGLPEQAQLIRVDSVQINY
jgi:hypothetical protein